jgi:hypothetical protein
MYVGPLLKRIHGTETDLAEEYRKTGERHAVEHDVFHGCHTLAKECVARANLLRPFVERYAGERPETEDEEPSTTENVLALLRRKMSEAVGRRESPGVLLLRDLTNLYLAVGECELLWTQARQAAQVLRDVELVELASRSIEQLTIELRWLKTRVKEAAPQTSPSGEPMGPGSLALIGSGEFEPWTDDLDRLLLTRATCDGSVVIVPTASANEGHTFAAWGEKGLDHYANLGVPSRMCSIRGCTMRRDGSSCGTSRTRA